MEPSSGPKLADRRLVKQEQTGKTMCQSSGMYTPAVAGFMDEKELMPWFHRLVAEFLRIEEQQYCLVNGKKAIHGTPTYFRDRRFKLPSQVY